MAISSSMAEGELMTDICLRPDMPSVGIHACFLLHVCNVFFRNPQALTWTHFLIIVLLAFFLFLWKSYCHTIFIMVKYLGFHCDIPNKDFPFIFYYYYFFEM